MEAIEGKVCRIDKCKRTYRAKGFCNVHYKKWRQGEFGKQRYKTCHNEGCLKPIYKSGACEEHFGSKAPIKEVSSVEKKEPSNSENDTKKEVESNA